MAMLLTRVLQVVLVDRVAKDAKVISVDRVAKVKMVMPLTRAL